MRRQGIRIELRQDAVFSRTSATAGAHRSLDYVPGSALLGACGSRLYRALGDDARVAFHSGRVRFCNGHPEHPGGAATWPVPLAWHRRKDARAEIEEVPGFTATVTRLNGPDIVNLCSAPPSAPADRLEQLRHGFVAEDGALVDVLHDYRLRTAVDRRSGSAAEAKLFGYESIREGTCFVAELQADDDVPDALWEQLLEAMRGELKLGRSKFSGAYGRARLELCDPPAAPASSAAKDPRGLTLWALSDLQLLDEYGAPTLAPLPETLGLGDGEVDWNRSFIRTRRFAPWNAARDARELDRSLIAAGSVISLRLNEPPDATPRALLQEGVAVGVGREAGFGQLCVWPALLETTAPEFAEPLRPVANASPVSPPEPSSYGAALIELLQRGADRRGRSRELERMIEAAEADLGERYRHARRMLGLPADAGVGPSSSQWSDVIATASTRSGDALRAALFDDADAICKATAEGWRDTCAAPAGDGHAVSFRDWLRHRLDGEMNDVDRARFARRIGRAAQRMLDRRAASDRDARDD